MKILVIEDDFETSDYIIKGLGERGHDVVSEETGDAGLVSAVSGDFDVLVIDRMLPGLDGLTIVQSLRRRSIFTPVLMLTAMGLLRDRVEGLECGADDYLVKPFDLTELSARIEAVDRRGRGAELTRLTLLDLSLDRLSRVVRRGEIEIDLQPREFQLLELLLLESPRIVTRTMLLERIWRFSFDPGTNLVESHISRLRGKIDRGGDRPIVHTIRGEGYAAFAD